MKRMIYLLVIIAAMVFMGCASPQIFYIPKSTGIQSQNQTLPMIRYDDGTEAMPVDDGLMVVLGNVQIKISYDPEPGNPFPSYKVEMFNMNAKSNANVIIEKEKGIPVWNLSVYRLMERRVGEKRKAEDRIFARHDDGLRIIVTLSGHPYTYYYPSAFSTFYLVPVGAPQGVSESKAIPNSSRTLPESPDSQEVVDTAAVIEDIITRWDTYASAASKREQVPKELIFAVIAQESGGDSKAVSDKGARGLMQLMPETASDMGVLNSFNPRQNINGGTKYLRAMLDRFNGDEQLALAAYNAGPDTVEAINGIPEYEETQEYVAAVLRWRLVFKAAIAKNPS